MATQPSRLSREKQRENLKLISVRHVSENFGDILKSTALHMVEGKSINCDILHSFFTSQFLKSANYKIRILTDISISLKRFILICTWKIPDALSCMVLRAGLSLLSCTAGSLWCKPQTLGSTPLSGLTRFLIYFNCISL